MNNYRGKMADMLRYGAFNDLAAKMMPQMDKSEFGMKLLEHHPPLSKIETAPYGAALKKS